MQKYTKEKIIKRNNFSIAISLIIFSYSILMFFLGQFNSDVLYSYRVLYPILMLITIGIVVYSAITHKKRSAIDYIIMTIIFIAVLSITIQCFIYFYRARTGDFYYSLYYDFPGILKFNTHWLVSVEPLKYELKSTRFILDPTLIASAVCIVISLTNRIKIYR